MSPCKVRYATAGKVVPYCVADWYEAVSSLNPCQPVYSISPDPDQYRSAHRVRAPTSRRVQQVPGTP